MDEWGIALVAFFGAIVGAVVGLFGLSRQRSAARDEDLRKVGAQLLYHGEVVMNRYMQYRAMPPEYRNNDHLQTISDSMEKVGELLRYLELVANKELYGKINEFVVVTQEFYTGSRTLPRNRSQLRGAVLEGINFEDIELEVVSKEWDKRRFSLVMALTFPGGRPLSWRIRQLKKVVFNPS